MAAQARIRRATGREISWFKQNEQRAQQVVDNALKARGAARFAGVTPMVAELLKQYLDEHAKQIKNPAKMRSMLRAGDLPPLRIPSTAITTSFKSDILSGEHESGDTYKIALYVAASTIGPSTTAYTATNEVANGGGYTTAGMNLAGRQVVTDGTTAILDWTTDPVWTSATITARGCLIYNDTNADKSIAVFDFGSDIVSTNGNFTVVLPSPTAAAGAIRIA